jgi:hypothetical protein
VLIKKEHFGDKLLEPTPIYWEDKFFNQNGDEFTIVHQYDRHPQIKELIYQKYK